MSASTLSELLAAQLPRELADAARRLNDAQTRLDGVVPGALLGHVRVMRFESGVLALACDSGAAASRLRHQGDELIEALTRNGMAVQSLRVQVKPELLAKWHEPVEKAGIPATALESLEKLDQGIEDGPLKDALDRLLRHHREG